MGVLSEANKLPPTGASAVRPDVRVDGVEHFAEKGPFRGSSGELVVRMSCKRQKAPRACCLCPSRVKARARSDPRPRREACLRGRRPPRVVRSLSQSLSRSGKRASPAPPNRRHWTPISSQATSPSCARSPRRRGPRTAVQALMHMQPRSLFPQFSGLLTEVGT